MTKTLPVHIIGFLGTTVDRAQGPERWSKWRPTVSLCAREEFIVSQYDLLYDRRWRGLAESLVKDIRHVSPQTKVVLHEMPFEDPWDFQEVYGKMYDFVRSHPFEPEKADYLIHLTTGTHVAQICWFLLTEANFIPGRLVQTSPPRGGGRDASTVGEYSIIVLDLS